MKSFEKDATDDDKTVTILRKAEDNKNKVVNLLPSSVKIHVGMMVSDIIGTEKRDSTYKLATNN